MKPLVIGMCHYGALPGDPGYDGKSLEEAADKMLADVVALQEGGVDVIMFSNEASQPWMLHNPSCVLYSMAAVIGRLKPYIKKPFGVHVIWDADSTVDLAAATDADYAWEVFSGVYASDYGLWNGTPFQYLKKPYFNRKKVKLLCEVVPEAGVSIGNRLLVDRAVSVNELLAPDGVCIAGLKPGVPPSESILQELKQKKVRIIASTGMRIDNIETYLPLVDGFIVGSYFKKEGKLFQSVEKDRVKKFMDKIQMLF